MALENAKKVVTDAADTVVKASGEFIEKTKIKYRIYDTKIDIKRLYEELGKVAYADYKNEENSEEEKERIFAEIKEKELYLEELNEKLD